MNKKKAQKNYIITKKILEGKLNIDTSMQDISDCVSWIIKSKKSEVGGRNFSVKHDEWKSIKFKNKLKKDKNFFK